MRRRKIKGADEKLLSFEGYIINGMIEQTISDDIKSSSSIFDKRIIVENEVYNNIANHYRGRWREFFGNDNPIYIELGTGRGKFITTLASKNSDINYIALEVKEEVLLRAVEKADMLNLDNLAFIWGRVEFLDIYFDEYELDRIYINFCDPWPKKRYAKRRLTHRGFLELYRRKLSYDGEIHFKTDNMSLFEYSICELSANNWGIKYLSLDLANSSYEDNETTEYEEKFMAQNMPIYRLEAVYKIK